jgi:murein DD-endopeptidase MepM/ murein hydrolase activator NlpD
LTTAASGWYGREVRSIWLSALILAASLTGAPGPGLAAPYAPPLAATPGLSSGFGEFRTAHFHAGLDYSTDQVEGKEVRAVEDGWVERVRASGVGYGRALYLRLADGHTAVYGTCRASRRSSTPMSRRARTARASTSRT